MPNMKKREKREKKNNYHQEDSSRAGETLYGGKVMQGNTVKSKKGNEWRNPMRDLFLRS